MATNNHKKNLHAEEMEGFPGLDASSPFGGGGAAQDIRNFKIMPDGSLCRRDGYESIVKFDSPIRAVRTYREGDAEYVLVVAGSMLCRIKTTGGVSRHAVVFSSETGPAGFFEYDGQVYIMDGHNIYHYKGEVSAELVHGYVPLYGRNWSIDGAGNTVNEPINLLSSMVRIAYRGTGTPSTLTPGLKMTAVESVRLDGETLAADRYALSEDGLSVVCNGIEMNESTLELAVTLDVSHWYDATLYTCTRASVYNGFSAMRMFLFGGSDGTVVHSNIPVSPESLAASEAADAASTGLYIPKDSQMTVGHREVVTAAVGIYDRMMFCTEGGSWLTDSLADSIDREARTIRLGSISGILGCSAPGAMCVIEGDIPITVCPGGIYRWDIDPTLEKGCIPRKISDSIAPLLPDGFYTRAVMRYMRTTDELWLCDPEDPNGRVMIYNCVGKCWYSYTEIGAGGFFEAGSRIGFIRGGAVCVFIPGRGTDRKPYSENDIVASFTSRYLDFGDPEALKKVVCLYLDADTGGGELEVTLADHGLLCAETLAAEEGVRLFSRRFTTPRFHRLALKLVAGGPKPQRIYRICLHPAI